MSLLERNEPSEKNGAKNKLSHPEMAERAAEIHNRRRAGKISPEEAESELRKLLLNNHVTFFKRMLGH